MAPRGWFLCSLAASLALTWPANAVAGGPGRDEPGAVAPAVDSAPVAPAVADASVAESGDGALDQLAKDAREAGIEETVIRRPVDEARRSVRRARGARAAGDESHAGMLDRLATDWQEVARALLRAARLEARARAQALRAQQLRTRVDRARALLAEQQAHRWRLQSELERLGAPSVSDAVSTDAAPAASQRTGGQR